MCWGIYIYKKKKKNCVKEKSNIRKSKYFYTLKDVRHGKKKKNVKRKTKEKKGCKSSRK